MFYKDIIDLKAPDFRRLVGIKKSTFFTMRKALERYEKAKKKRNRRKNKRKAGRKPSLGIEDQLLMTLMYWREYRTQFHIGVSYGMSEANVCRTIQKVENVLSQNKRFQLPMKKNKMGGTNISYEVVLVDATESPIERPKKNRSNIIQGKRKSIP